jgi:hypothetical protein
MTARVSRVTRIDCIIIILIVEVSLFHVNFNFGDFVKRVIVACQQLQTFLADLTTST